MSRSCVSSQMLAEYLVAKNVIILNIILFRKQVAELESEKRYLEKSNKHLEKILDATKAHSKQEVCQLNKIHAETIKVE